MARSQGRTGRPWRRAAAQVRRNGHVCWLCGEVIDLTLDAKHPKSYTTDHVVAVASMRPDDPRLRDPANLRPAHRDCNTRKGTGQPRPRDRFPTSSAW